MKNPADGWKGVKDGVIEIGGEKIEFSQWIKDVQHRWKAAWDDFWAKHEGVTDIM